MEIFTIQSLKNGKTSTMPYYHPSPFEEPEIEVQLEKGHLFQQNSIAMWIFIQRLNHQREW